MTSFTLFPLQDTGCPPLPLLFIPWLIGAAITTTLFLVLDDYKLIRVWACLAFLIPFLVFMPPFYILINKRTQGILRELRDWNRLAKLMKYSTVYRFSTSCTCSNVGASYNIHLQLGVQDQETGVMSVGSRDFFRVAGKQRKNHCGHRFGIPHLHICDGRDESNNLNMNCCGCYA